jgi:hypothetical protein
MTGRDSASETLCSLEYRTMNKVQKPSNPECYTPSSETFRITNKNDTAYSSYVTINAVAFNTRMTLSEFRGEYLDLRMRK